jgi:4-hydroxybenzoyl-CoA reductase subunit beta
MKLPKFLYFRPKTIEEALATFTAYDGNAVYLAGGTDLIPRMKLKLKKPTAVIDLKGIGELKNVRLEDHKVVIGPLVTLFELSKTPMIKERFPALFEALMSTSCETLQMRGTIGGNILQDTRCLFYNQSEFWRKAKGACLKTAGERCHVTGAKECLSNYMSDTAPALLSLEASLKLIGIEGEREIPLKEIFTGNGIFPLSLRPGEILYQISIPNEPTKGGYEKLRLRGSIDYPLLGIALSGSAEKVKVAIGGIGPAPKVWEGKLEDLPSSMEKLSQEIKAIANTILDPLYRRHMIPVLSRRLAKRVFGN